MQQIVDKTKKLVEHKIDTVRDIPKEWTQLAAIDESVSYDVDRTEIYATPEGDFVLATASGCSCWDGEYQVEHFESLDEIEEAWKIDREYNFSFKTGTALLAEAREKLDASVQA